MEPIDKFGNTIYPRVFQRMCLIAARLTDHGYQETRSKPNLLRCHYHHVTFWADLRGTTEVYIWEDTRALWYWQFHDATLPLLVRKRMIAMEWLRLGNIPRRLSREVIYNPDTTDEMPPMRMDNLFYIGSHGWGEGPGWGQLNPG